MSDRLTQPHALELVRQEPRRIYTIGQRVRVHGYEGRVLAEYMPGMWEVRLEHGDVCVPWQGVYPCAQ